MKYNLVAFFCLQIFNGCNPGKIEYFEKTDYFKVMSIDTSTFNRYNFIILENEDNIISLLTERNELSEKHSTYTIIDTLKRNKSYKIEIKHIDSVAILTLKNKSYPIKGYAYNQKILWENDTLLVPAYISKDVREIYLIKEKK